MGQALHLPELVDNARATSNSLFRRNIVWWLRNKIRDVNKGKRLSYVEIAKSSGYTKGNVQISITTVERIMRRGVTNEFLAQLMGAAASIGMEPNCLYDYLANQNLVPRRERPIDGFDDLGSLL